MRERCWRFGRAILTVKTEVVMARLAFAIVVLNTKRVENALVQSLDIFSVMVHAIETQDIPT